MAEAGLLELQLAEVGDSVFIILSSIGILAFASILAYCEWSQSGDE